MVFSHVYDWAKANATRTDDEQQFITTGLLPYWDRVYWMDLTDHQDGPGYDWRFSDGSKPTDTQWLGGWPRGDYACVFLGPQWSNIPCSFTHQFVCQRPTED